MAYTAMSVSQMREMAETAESKLTNAQKTMAKIRDKAESAIQTGIQIAEVSGTAFAFGYANGRWGDNGELTIGGMPVDLGAAVALHGVAFLGGLGKYAEHGHNLGTGALAACAYRTGAQMGAETAAKSHAKEATDPAAKNAPAPWMFPPWSPPQQPQQPAGATPQQPQIPNFAPPTPRR